MRVVIQNLVIRPFPTRADADQFIRLTSKYHGPKMEVLPLPSGFLVTDEKNETFDTDGLIRGFDPKGKLA